MIACSRCRRRRFRKKILENEDIEDRIALLANQWILKKIPCAFAYISQPSQSYANHWKEHLWLVRFTGSFFRKTDSLTFTLATTAGQLASLFHWRRGLSTTLILKGREIFLAGHDLICYWVLDPSLRGSSLWPVMQTQVRTSSRFCILLHFCINFPNFVYFYPTLLT